MSKIVDKMAKNKISKNKISNKKFVLSLFILSTFCNSTVCPQPRWFPQDWMLCGGVFGEKGEPPSNCYLWCSVRFHRATVVGFGLCSKLWLVVTFPRLSRFWGDICKTGPITLLSSTPRDRHEFLQPNQLLCCKTLFAICCNVPFCKGDFVKGNDWLWNTICRRCRILSTPQTVIMCNKVINWGIIFYDHFVGAR